ncbi:hypothetical protein G6O67_008360 [Ophiocordyceps sinensis]|uniref:Uncharacterized protein n=1 Tax=Ophiocordyceps sinensis TaxID=72228 RepID=A0A8H4PIQ8_9HYPO|nr:hypothetical protein G6O67_008360 [Ophiocordyceps sinensis]
MSSLALPLRPLLRLLCPPPSFFSLSHATISIMPPTTPTPPAADDVVDFATLVDKALAAPSFPEPRGDASRAAADYLGADAAGIELQPIASPGTSPLRRLSRLSLARIRRQQAQKRQPQRVVSLETQAQVRKGENPLFKIASEMTPVSLGAVGANLCALVFQPTPEHREELGGRWRLGHGLIHSSTVLCLMAAVFCLVVRERAARVRQGGHSN